MNISYRVALAAVVAMGAMVPASANHSWGNYHWGRTDNPLVLTVNEALSANWEGHLTAALVDWDRSSVIDFTSNSPKESSTNPKKCTAVPGQVLVCNAVYGQRGWLGIATIWISGNHITKATTKVNDTYFNMPQYNTPDWRQSVMCQEVGHDFGLDHQDENFNNANLGSCMDYTNNPSTNTKPNAHDYEQLETIYEHLDSTDTAINTAATNFGIRQVGRPVPQASGDDPGDTMAEWGRAVRTDALGRPDVFVKELGGGRRKITHVYWALEAKGHEAQ